MRKSKTLPLVLAALFTAITAISTFLKIDFPVVPFTFQIIVVLLAGPLLGSKYGSISQILYILIGLIGFPIFAHGGGPQYALQPTFGYLFGYIFAALVGGLVIERIAAPKLQHFLAASLIGLVPIYIFGLGYLYIALNYIVGSPTSISKVLTLGFTGFILFDILKAIIAGFIASRLYKYVPQK